MSLRNIAVVLLQLAGAGMLPAAMAGLPSGRMGSASHEPQHLGAKTLSGLDLGCVEIHEMKAKDERIHHSGDDKLPALAHSIMQFHCMPSPPVNTNLWVSLTY